MIVTPRATLVLSTKTGALLAGLSPYKLHDTGELAVMTLRRHDKMVALTGDTTTTEVLRPSA